MNADTESAPGPERALGEDGDLRLFLAAYFALRGASVLLLPPGPLSVLPETLVWMTGVTMLGVGLGVLWLGFSPAGRSRTIGHAALGLVPIIQGVVYLAGGAASGGVLMLAFGLTIMLVLSGSTRGRPADALCLVLAVVAGFQGLAVILRIDSSSTILDSAGVSTTAYGLFMVLSAGLVLALGATARDRRGLRVLAGALCGAATIGVTALATVAVSPLYLLLGGSVLLRAGAQVAHPFRHGGVQVDWASVESRISASLLTAVVLPAVLMPAVALRLDADTPTLVHQVTFGIVTGVVVIAFLAARRAGARLSGQLTALASQIRHDPAGIGTVIAPPATEIKVIADATHAMARRIEAQIEQLELQNEALRAANTSKDEFLGLVSHELKTPITTILGNAVLLQKLGDRPEREEVTRDLLAEVSRLTGIVDNLLALARLEAGQTWDREPLLMDHLVQHAIERLRSQFGPRVTRVAAERGVVVEANPEHLEMVVRNLLSNAYKYSPPDEPVDVGIRSEGRYAVVEVCDLGPGVGAGEEESIFDAFYRSREVHGVQGMGVGLTVCRRLVEASGGQIWATNRADGRGAIFTFTTPLSIEADPETGDGVTFEAVVAGR